MKNIHKQSSLLILELIISITFFVLSTLVCVQIFVKSHEISNQTKDVTIAMNYCTGVLEEFENDPTLYKNKKEYFKYYNQNWEKSSKKKATYTISIYCKEENSLKKIQVKAYQQKKKIYSLNDEVYVKEDIYGN